MEVTIKQPNLTEAPLPIPSTVTDADQALHFVFDGPPGPECGRFVECETPDGRSVNAGEWHERGDGYWELRVPMQSARTPDTIGIPSVVQERDEG